MNAPSTFIQLRRSAPVTHQEAGYHAVDTDDDCFSNNSGEFNSTEFLNLKDDADPALLLALPDGQQQQQQQPQHQSQHQQLLQRQQQQQLLRQKKLQQQLGCRSGAASEQSSSRAAAAAAAAASEAALASDPALRLIEALESLRDSINDNTSVSVQQSRVRNRRRGTSTGQVNYKTGGVRTDDRSRVRAEKVVVELRVVFLKIGEIDTLKEFYHADAFIQAKWKEPLLEGRQPEELKGLDLEKYWNPLLYIDNILNETKEATWVVAQLDPITHDTYIVERRRIKGVFLETLELNDFPLDVQDLTITITSERPDTEIELIPDEAEMSGINIQTFVDQQEWRLHEHIEVEKRTLTQEFSSTMKSHPCLSVRCRAARRPGYFYWNVFLIMFFITGLSFATFTVSADKPENRLQLSFTLFLTSVAFKFVINQSLPKISYLTYMDKYVLMSLAILCIVSIWHAVVTLIKPPSFASGNSTHEAESPMAARDCFLQFETGETCSQHLRRMEMVNKIEQDVFISFGILYIMAHVIFIFWLYYDASRRRREMHKKDREYRNKVQFYQMLETHSRSANRLYSIAEAPKQRHHHHHHHQQHHQHQQQQQQQKQRQANSLK